MAERSRGVRALWRYLDVHCDSAQYDPPGRGLGRSAEDLDRRRRQHARAQSSSERDCPRHLRLRSRDLPQQEAAVADGGNAGVWTTCSYSILLAM